MLGLLLNMSFANRIEKGRFIPELKRGDFSHPDLKKKFCFKTSLVVILGSWELAAGVSYTGNCGYPMFAWGRFCSPAIYSDLTRSYPGILRVAI